MANIKDISRISGYSITTVSKALNNYSDISEATKEKILKICKEMDYVPNAIGRSLSSKRTYTIGIVFLEETGLGITHPYFAELLNEFKKEIEARGYDILLIGNRIGNYVHTYLEHCKQKSVDGIIILSAYPEAPQIKEILQSNIPKVIMQQNINNVSSFESNDHDAMVSAVEYLATQMGHERIAVVTGDLATNEGTSRYQGYLDGLRECGLKTYPNYLFEGKSYSIAEGNLAAEQFMALENKPTAVLCSSDTLAVGVIQEYQRKGLNVPNDVSVVGFDNIPISQSIYPKLTTISQDRETLAKLATESLLRQIEQKDTSSSITIVKTKLIERESVKKIA